jgi:hypothetical protein
MTLHLRPLPGGLLHLPPATEKILSVLLPAAGAPVTVDQLRALFTTKQDMIRELSQARPLLERLGFWVIRVHGGYTLLRNDQ